MRYYLIGCGGVGCWVLPALVRMVKPSHVVCLDGDRFTAGNLDRQWFDPEEVGSLKAQALALKYGTDFRNDYFQHGLMSLDRRDVLLVCVDNHATRCEALASCDVFKCRAILASNESWSSEALYYQPSFKDSPQDPRIRYPEMLDDHSGDPRAQAIGCVEAAARGGTQTVSANFMAAAQLLHLLQINVLSLAQFEPETLNHLPVSMVVNLSSCAMTKRV